MRARQRPLKPATLQPRDSLYSQQKMWPTIRRIWSRTLRFVYYQLVRLSSVTQANVFHVTYNVTQCNTSTFRCNVSFQVFASDMSDSNRDACAASTRPLINSVESLAAYALSPEFAAVPAKISDEVRNVC